jgi:single-strand DNA-binding protein
MNLIVSTGRVGMVNIRNLPDGTPVTSVSVAMNKSWKDKQGQRQEKTTWIRFSFWGKQAEIANQILNTGDLVTITGEITEPSVFQDKNGKYVAAIEARGNEIEKLSKKGEHADDATAATQAPATTQPPTTTQPELTIPVGGNDAPF